MSNTPRWYFILTIGLIFGTGESDGVLRIFDLTSQKNVITFDAHENGVNSISFSENGFYLASSGNNDNIVKLWDLRGPKLVRQIHLAENKEVRSIKFDKTGQYLAIAGSGISVVNIKTASIVAEFTNHTDIVTDVAFGKNIEYMASTSLDRNLNVYN